MAGAEGIRAGRAYVELGTNNAPLAAGLNRASAQLKAWGAGIQRVGMSMAKTGAVLGLPVGFGAKMFGEFEGWMARTKALAGPAADEFAALNAEALKLGRDTVFTATDAAKTMSIFAQAGLNAGDILKATAPTLDLAATGMLDMATSADISLKVMKGMGLQASQLGEVVDVLAKAMVTANTDLVMLGEAFKYVGPVAKAAGMSIHETTAAIQLLSDAGIQADMAGTTLRGMLLSLTAPSVEAAAELERLGLQVSDAKGNFRGMVAIVTDLEAALQGVGTGARLKSLGTIFSARQAAGGAELITQGGQKLLKYVDALREAGGTAARVAATQLDTLGGAWKILTSSLEGVVIAVGQGVAPLLRQWGEALTGAANATTLLIEKNPEFFKTLAKVSAGLVLGGAALVAFGAVVAAAGSVLGILGAGFALVGKAAALWLNPTFIALRWVATGLYMIPGASGVATSAMGKFTDAMRAAGASVSGVLKVMWGDVQTAFAGIRDSMAMGDMVAAQEVGWLGIKVVWEQGTAYLKGVWGDFTGWVGGQTTDLWAEIDRGFVNLTSSMGLNAGTISETFGLAIEFWEEAFDSFIATVNTFIDALKLAYRTVAQIASVMTDAQMMLTGGGVRFGGGDLDAAGTAPAPNDGFDRAADDRRLDVLGRVESNRAAAHRARREAQQRAAAERQAAVDAARQQLQDAADAAKDRRAYEEFLAVESKVPGAGAGLEPNLPDVTRSLDAANRKLDTAGTFGGFGVGQSLAFGKSLAEQSLDAAKETAKNTKKIADEGGGVKVI